MEKGRSTPKQYGSLDQTELCGETRKQGEKNMMIKCIRLCVHSMLSRCIGLQVHSVCTKGVTFTLMLFSFTWLEVIFYLITESYMQRMERHYLS